MIRLERSPRLKRPYLIVGWPDAGYVGLKAVSYLQSKVGAIYLGEIEPYEFSSMPDSIIKEGVLKGLEFPPSQFHYWKGKKAPDLIFFLGRQPAIRPYSFANLILDVAEKFGVRRIYTVGGFFASLLHTGKPQILAVVNEPSLKRAIKGYEVEIGEDYHGPTSMNGLLLGVAKERGIEGISLWGQVPHYIGELPNPKIAHAAISVLTQMLKLSLNLSELVDEAELAEKEIDRLVNYVRQQSPDFAEYLDKLEKGTLTKDEGERFFKEIEDFLKRQRGQG